MKALLLTPSGADEQVGQHLEDMKTWGLSVRFDKEVKDRNNQKWDLWNVEGNITHVMQFEDFIEGAKIYVIDR